MKDWREYPKGYLEARGKYLGGAESVENLWTRLRLLRNLRAGFREFNPESGENPPEGYRETGWHQWLWQLGAPENELLAKNLA